MPDSLRFWKSRIEERDPSRTFSVGLIYGPSGSGKSSLVRGGLLPQLSPDVTCVYLAATPSDTESRLLSGLRHCGAIDNSRCLDLKATLSALRLEGGISAGRKVLIVIDQFEQWLHARANPPDLELVEALRQCDGAHVQCLILVRDDFWLGVTRFFNELEVNLVQGHNAAVVDLFEADHARRILAAFGRAFGRLPDQIAATTREQHDFLDEATDGLAQNGKVVGAHLALFADMMKDKPWTPTALNQAGGTSGVGETFLDATFSPPTANPRHRVHQATARAVLAALLPDQVTDIRGHMRSLDEVRQAVGSKVSAADFDDVIQLLDGEVRLITPTEPPPVDDEIAVEGRLPAERCYQLTHDYLVQPLRNWLTRKRQETRRGRAELHLAERSRLWHWRKDRRFLPTLLEYLNFRIWTESRCWNDAERALMGQSGRRHLFRVSAALVLLVSGCMAALSIREELAKQREILNDKHLVDKFRTAETTKVPDLIEEVAKHRPRIDPLLLSAYKSPDSESNFKLNTALALLPDDRVVQYLHEQLPKVTAAQFPIVRDKLKQHQHSETAIPKLRELALEIRSRTRASFQAACALATYAPDDDALWTEIGEGVIDYYFLNLEASERATWRATLAPAAKFLVPRLRTVYRDPLARVDVRIYAAEALVAFLGNNPQELFDLLADSEQSQFPWVFERIEERFANAFAVWAVGVLDREAAELAELAKVPAATVADQVPRESLGRRLANIAVALLKLEQVEADWRILKHTSDDRARSLLIHLVQPLGVDPFRLVAGFRQAKDVSIKMALMQALGEYPPAQLKTANSIEWGTFLAEVLNEFETNIDAGMHSNADWLLRKWHQVDNDPTRSTGQEAISELWDAVTRLKPRNKDRENYGEFNVRDAAGGVRRNWFVNSQGQTYAILELGEYVIGSPAAEKGPRENELARPSQTRRRFAIATREVTREEFTRFLRTKPPEDRFLDVDLLYMPDTDSPAVTVNWQYAAEYCNWLSQRNGISDPSEQCYVLKPDGGWQEARGFLERPGFRLPTEEEWEYACRAGTVTSRYYGESPELLPHYACFLSNGSHDGEAAAPVGQWKPNDFGLFDTLGNAYEWCNEIHVPVGKSFNLRGRKEFRVYRGGGFSSLASYSQASRRAYGDVEARNPQTGLRPVRTLPPRKQP